MAMTAGSVTIAGDGTETGAVTTTMAGALYLELKKIQEVDYGIALPSGSEGVAAKKGLSFLANHLATALVTFLTTHATAKIPNSAAGDGLVRTPNPNNADTDCQRPSADKFLSIV